MKNIFLLSAVVVSLACWSCGPSYEMQEELVIPEAGWSYQDSLLASFEIVDTNTIYNLHLLIDHSTDFPYQNFYVVVHTYFPDGQALSEQLSLEIAHKAGYWVGDCNDEECRLDIPIQEGAYFNQMGEYKISIEQFSRENPLPGIQGVAFALEDTGERRSY